MIVRESFILQNPYATRFVLPVGILTLSSLIQMLAYYLADPNPFFSLVQAGVFIFLFLISFIAGLNVKDSIHLKTQAQRLKYEKNLLQLQTDDQRESRLLLARKEAELSRQRHDLRHHLTAIQELSGDNAALQSYLASLMEQIPTARERFCENTVVNAIISHFAARCRKEGVTLTSTLCVPETENQKLDSDLCVVFANLMENAIEACARMESGEKTILLSSQMKNKMLVVTMENSFNGEVKRVGGRFRSSKRDAYGIGLSSLQAIAEAAHGGTEFRSEGNVFYSNVFLLIP